MGKSGPYQQGEEAGAARFARGEGAWEHGGAIYWVDTAGGAAGAGAVWVYNPAKSVLRALYVSPREAVADAPDNITVHANGLVLACEDGGGVHDAAGELIRGTRLLALGRDGGVVEVGENNIVLDGLVPGRPEIDPGDYRGAEWAGATFSPDGATLFVNIQTRASRLRSPVLGTRWRRVCSPRTRVRISPGFGLRARADLARSAGRYAVLAALVAAGTGPSAMAEGWPHYGGSLGGDRRAVPSSITPENVGRLAVAWTYRTGDATDGEGFDGNPSRFRATPILVGGRLVASTGFNRVFALDPATGQELWTYDPGVDFSDKYSEMFTSRGVAAWRGRASDPERCRERVFLGTLDARLIALDAATGIPCTDFGRKGQVDLSAGIRVYRKRDYSVTSPPTVVGDLVIVGSSIGDNLESGVVRAYGVRDGALAWSWDPLPRSDDHPGASGWPRARRNRTGGANVWSVMSADPGRDLVFLPTTSPSPDFYGGKRPGDNAFANSVVALRASTGEFVWGYQTVRHDLWEPEDILVQGLPGLCASPGRPRAGRTACGRAR